MKAGPAKDPNSVNSNGRTSVAIDVFTRDTATILARQDQKHLGRYFRDLVIEDAKRKGETVGVILPEWATSEAEGSLTKAIASVRTEVEAMRDTMASFLTARIIAPIIGGDNDPVNIRGEALTMKDLPFEFRVATMFAGHAGKRIDFRSRREIDDAMLEKGRELLDGLTSQEELPLPAEGQP